MRPRTRRRGPWSTAASPAPTPPPRAPGSSASTAAAIWSCSTSRRGCRRRFGRFWRTEGFSSRAYDVIYDVMYVLDTNILVAALWSRKGASFELLSRAIEGRLAIAVSVALALEYEDVLKRVAIAEASW